MSRTLFVYEKTLFVYAQPLHKVKQKSYLFLFYLTLLNSLCKFQHPSLIETESHYQPIGRMSVLSVLLIPFPHQNAK
jgi:hypothetical protein